MEVWWFKLQELRKEAASEPDTHRARTVGELDVHHRRARRTPWTSQTSTTSGPDAHPE